MSNIHKLRGSVTFSDNPELNFTAQYLTQGMFNISADNAPSNAIPLAIGMIVSKETTLMRTLTFSLNKASELANVWLDRINSDCQVGNANIQMLVPNLKEKLLNCTITKAPDYDESGQSADLTFSITGYKLINTSLI
jgi:hypothetical protein